MTAAKSSVNLLFSLCKYMCVHHLYLQRLQFFFNFRDTDLMQSRFTQSEPSSVSTKAAGQILTGLMEQWPASDPGY